MLNCLWIRFFPIFSGVIKQPMIDENHVKISHERAKDCESTEAIMEKKNVLPSGKHTKSYWKWP